MKDEGYKSINIRHHGLSAYRCYKQWWYFEGLDPTQNIYYVFLALKEKLIIILINGDY